MQPLLLPAEPRAGLSSETPKQEDETEQVVQRLQGTSSI